MLLLLKSVHLDRNLIRIKSVNLHGEKKGLTRTETITTITGRSHSVNRHGADLKKLVDISVDSYNNKQMSKSVCLYQYIASPCSRLFGADSRCKRKSRRRDK